MDHLQLEGARFAIRAAETSDALAIWQLRERLADWMLSRGIEQWHPGELGVEAIADSVDSTNVFVIECSRVVMGSVTVSWSDPYVWGAQTVPAGYIHQLMVSREHAGHSLGSAVLAWAEDWVRISGRHLARLDCVRSNRRLRNYYEDHGYKFVRHQNFGGQPSPLLSGAVPAETALYEKAL